MSREALLSCPSTDALDIFQWQNDPASFVVRVLETQQSRVDRVFVVWIDKVSNVFDFQIASGGGDGFRDKTT